MNRNALATLSILVALNLAACAPVTQAAATLDGTGWQLVTLNGQGPLPDVAVTLSFTGGKVSGTDGCNRFSASYNSGDGKLTVGKDMVSTKMACAGPVMQQGMAYLAALARAAAYQSDGKLLVLLDADGRTLMTFAAQSTTLAGSSWVATGYNDGKGGVVSVISGTTVTAAFNAEGTVSGRGGCNSYGGKYEVSGQGLKFGMLASTAMACPSAGVMEQEGQYFKALATVASYRVEGNQLELRTADGAIAATFARAR